MSVPGMVGGGVCLLGGGGVDLLGGLPLDGDQPPLMNRQSGVKTLPSPAIGKNCINYHPLAKLQEGNVFSRSNCQCVLRRGWEGSSYDYTWTCSNLITWEPPHPAPPLPQNLFKLVHYATIHLSASGRLAFDSNIFLLKRWFKMLTQVGDVQSVVSICGEISQILLPGWNF